MSTIPSDRATAQVAAMIEHLAGTLEDLLEAAETRPAGLDLSGLDAAAHAMCEAVEHLPRDQARQLEPRLAVVMAQLAVLAERMAPPHRRPPPGDTS